MRWSGATCRAAIPVHQQSRCSAPKAASARGFDLAPQRPEDGGAAIAATLNGPKHLCIDHDGAVIIADTENHVIRKYFPKDGKIIRLAGKGTRGTAGVGGPALEVEFNQPHGVYVHPAGDLYISDSSNRRILKIVRPK